jgi:hypothetical protein
VSPRKYDKVLRIISSLLPKKSKGNLSTPKKPIVSQDSKISSKNSVSQDSNKKIPVNMIWFEGDFELSRIFLELSSGFTSLESPVAIVTQLISH